MKYPLKNLWMEVTPNEYTVVVFSNDAIKEEMMFQDSDDGQGSYNDG